MAGFENTSVAESRFERVASRNLIRNHHFFLRNYRNFSSALLGQKCPTYNNQNKGSLSENVTKDGERVLFALWSLWIFFGIFGLILEF